MFKLYKRVEGLLSYREGWQDNFDVVEHWGVCGERGESKIHSFDLHIDALNKMLSLEKEVRGLGYRGISDAKHAWLIVEFTLGGLPANTEPLSFRHKLEDYLNELTGWLGLGHCDGGSMGSGSLEAACPVVDYDVASRSIAREMAGTEFSAYSRIYREAR